jgi:hypothetical protein
VVQDSVQDWVDVAAAAARPGVSQEGVRKRIQRKQVPAEKRDGRWYVLLPQLDSVQDRQDSGSDLCGTDQDTVVLALLERLDRAHRDNLELAGRCGFYQAENLQLKSQVQAMQVRILELEAPKVASAEMSNYSAPEQNGQDSGSQAVSAVSEEQPEAGRRCEVSAPPATNGQEGSSGGAFKRFWRWLARPV